MAVLPIRIIFIASVIAPVCNGLLSTEQIRRTLGLGVQPLRAKNLTIQSNVTSNINTTSDGVNSTVTDLATTKTRRPEIPTTLRAIIGFLATRAHRNGTDFESSWLNGSDSTSSSQNVTGADNNSTGYTSLSASTATGKQQTTSLLPETTETRHTSIPDTSSAAHSPDGAVVDDFPTEAETRTWFSGATSTPDISKPIIKHLEERVEPNEEQTEQGSLPLVLGAAIVVIFGVGVAGAAVTAKCRKRKLALKEGLSESSSATDMERGIDNPAFLGADKSTNDLSAVFKSIPGNNRIHSEMGYATAMDTY